MFLGEGFRRSELSPVVHQARDQNRTKMQFDIVREIAQLVKLQISVRGYDVKKLVRPAHPIAPVLVDF